MSVRVFTFEVTFKHLFAPKMFRDSEVVSGWTTLTNKGCKIPAQKKLVFGNLFLTEQDFLVSVILSISVKRLFVSRMGDSMSKVQEKRSTMKSVFFFMKCERK